jgi:isoleucyl-tRNA synthetase
MTPQLRRAGIARDIIRLVQQARKDTGLHITDRITLTWSAAGETAEAIHEHHAHICAEVLAVTCSEAADTPSLPATVEDSQLGVKAWIERASTR